MNQLLGPVLFKAAILGVSEAHTIYTPSQEPSKLCETPPARPKPRSAVVIAPRDDPEATALRARLSARAWEVAPCDAAFSAASLREACNWNTRGDCSERTWGERLARLSRLAERSSDASLAERLCALIAMSTHSVATAPVSRSWR